MYLTLCLGHVLTTLLYLSNLLNAPVRNNVSENSPFKMCFIRRCDRRFLLLLLRKDYPSPTVDLYTLMGSEARRQKPRCCERLHFVLNMIRKRSLMKRISINCRLGDKIRPSAGQPGNQCNFEIWQVSGAEKHRYITQPLNRRTCVWETDVTTGSLAIPATCFMDHFSML